MDSPARPVVIADPDGLLELVDRITRASRVAVDVEASGMFAYSARPCTVQLAWDGGRQFAIVDALATSIHPLGPVLGIGGPTKVVHDVAFDARLLADSGIVLGNVRDTSVAARMLSRPATGLATLLNAELGVRIEKTLQQHDWRARPLDGPMLEYLAADVVHLEALEQKLWSEAASRGIEDAIVEETRYRIDSALAASRSVTPKPPYARVKGASHLAARELAVLRVAAELREREAQLRDVPPHQVASAEALLEIARSRPHNLDALAKIRGISLAMARAQEFAATLLDAVAAAGDAIPEAERVLFEPLRLPADEARRRRQREVRLIAWRRAEAKRRGVDEQVVLPGHCLKEVAESFIESADALGDVAGFGAFRVRDDGEAIARILRGESPEGAAA